MLCITDAWITKRMIIAGLSKRLKKTTSNTNKITKKIIFDSWMLTSKHHIWKERKTYKHLDKNEHTLFLILRRTFFKALSSTYPNLKQKIYF